MPFVITTTPPIPTEPYCARSSDWCAGDNCAAIGKDVCPGRIITRAVAALEEPGAVENAIGGPLRANVNQFEWHDLVTAVRQLGDGGTVGPLPDGSLIEVEPVTTMDLLHALGRKTLDPMDAGQIIAAFNATQEG